MLWPWRNSFTESYGESPRSKVVKQVSKKKKKKQVSFRALSHQTPQSRECWPTTNCIMWCPRFFGLFLAVWPSFNFEFWTSSSDSARKDFIIRLCKKRLHHQTLQEKTSSSDPARKDFIIRPCKKRLHHQTLQEKIFKIGASDLNCSCLWTTIRRLVVHGMTVDLKPIVNIWWSRLKLFQIEKNKDEESNCKKKKL